MHTLRCVLAEWQLFRARVLRTRLGLWLVLLGGGFAWIGARVGADRAAQAILDIALRVGSLSAVLCVAFGAGSDTDRAALRLTLTHPTTPAAIAAGRWLAATGIATFVTLAATAAGAWATGVGVGGGWLRAMTAGIGTAAATAGCSLVVVWLGGNACAGVLFLYMVLLSPLSPAGLEHLAPPGWLRRVGELILATAPALWRYRSLGTGSRDAWLHAAAWTGGGVLIAGRLVRRVVR